LWRLQWNFDFYLDVVVELRRSILIFMMQEMIDEADRDGDGEVNEEEFLRIMKKTNLF